jgi:hypothetical protein
MQFLHLRENLAKTGKNRITSCLPTIHPVVRQNSARPLNLPAMLLVSLHAIHFKRILNFGKGQATLEMFEIFARDYLACDARTLKNQKEKVPAQFPRFEFEVS